MKTYLDTKINIDGSYSVKVMENDRSYFINFETRLEAQAFIDKFNNTQKLEKLVLAVYQDLMNLRNACECNGLSFTKQLADLSEALAVLDNQRNKA